MASQVHNLGFSWSTIKIFAVLNVIQLLTNSVVLKDLAVKDFTHHAFKQFFFILQKEVKKVLSITWSVMVAELSFKMCDTVQSLPNHAIFLFF